MKFENITGSIVAMITPYHAGGSVNFEVLTQLLERQIQAGTDAILTLGTTGEYATMTHEEDATVVAHTLKVVNGRVPVIVGSGSNSTATQLEKSVEYQDMGADALLLIAPYYNKANPEGMYRHFASAADAVHIPCLLYNVPGRTGCSIPLSVVERLAKHPNICGIKEASGDMSYAMKIAHCVGPDFALYSGNDDITLPLLSIGGSGVISVWDNIMPRQCHDLVMAYLKGRQKEAVAAAERNAAAERTERERQEARVAEVQQELQDLVKKHESLERDSKTRESELATALESAKAAKAEAYKAL